MENSICMNTPVSKSSKLDLKKNQVHVSVNHPLISTEIRLNGDKWFETRLDANSLPWLGSVPDPRIPLFVS